MKYALITGANSLLAQTVIASIQDDFFLFLVDANKDLSTRYQDSKHVKVMIYDLTNEAVFSQIYQEVSSQTPTLDLVIHFAGIVELGALVEINIKTFDKVMRVNLYACYQMNQVLFPLLKNGKGRIIHVSSEYGRLLGLPFHSFYTMSKHALEIYNDSLRRELAFFGIKVIKIRPGAYKTSMQGNVTRQFERLLANTEHFAPPLTKMQTMMLNELKVAKDPKKIVKTFKKAIYRRHPKLAYNSHHSWKMKILNVLPPRLQDLILSKFF